MLLLRRILNMRIYCDMVYYFRRLFYKEMCDLYLWKSDALE